MAIQQCVCGVRFDPANAAEADRHAAQHESWSRGVALPELSGQAGSLRLAGVDVFEITEASPAPARVAAERVARRALQDTPFHEPSYLAADTGPDVRVLIARDEDRAVGLVVLRHRTRWGWWSWDDYDAEQRPSAPVAPLPSWTVEQIWTLPARQHQGLAQQLLRLAAERVHQPIGSFAWRRPFTPSGEAFVRRMCPEGFWIPNE